MDNYRKVRKAEVLMNEGLFQEACRKYVNREVLHCASTLMSAISEIMWNCPNYREAFCEYAEDTMELFQQRDYEEVVNGFIMDDADLDELEWVTEKCGWWDDVLSAVGFESAKANLLVERETLEAQIADAEDDEVKASFEDELSDLPEELDLEEWLDDDKDRWAELRVAVRELVTENSEREEIADEYNLDPEYVEVYEHWVIDSHLAKELRNRGEIVRDFCDFTIWGRCTTGQAIALDGVIRNIVRNIDEHWYVWD